MFKIKLVDPQSNETENDVCLHNLRVADRYHNLSCFIAASMGWFKLNSGKNYQDLEITLRKMNLETHLCARKPAIPKSKLSIGRKIDNGLVYECIFSCRPRKEALQEVLIYGPSYKENLHRLKQAGSIMSNDNQETATIKYNSQVDTHRLISSNLKKIEFETVSMDDYLEELNTKCINQFGKTVTKKIVANNQSGGPIYGLFVDNELISDVGLSVQVGDREVVDLVKIHLK